MNNTRKPINKPNFFILGAGKSGTTTLYAYLKSHPQIFMTSPKEPTFFCADFQVIKNPISYFELFDGVKDQPRIGEASHGYLSDPKSARVLHGLFPKSKFILSLRNPADRAYSLFHHMRRHGLESITTFEKALEAEEERFHSPTFRKSNPQFFYNFMYFRSGLYGSQIERFFSFFHHDRFFFTSFERVAEAPQDVTKKIFDFLGVDPSFKIVPKQANPGYTFQSFWLQKFLQTSVLPGFKLKERIMEWNKTPIPPMKDTTKQDLTEQYKADQMKLFDLTGIALE